MMGRKLGQITCRGVWNDGGVVGVTFFSSTLSSHGSVKIVFMHMLENARFFGKLI